MNSALTLTGITVLASLLLICFNYGSASLLYNDCGSNNQESGPGPWTALLHENGEIFCAGTLITKSFILTAANCIRINTIVKVRLGEYGRKDDNFAEDHLVLLSLKYRYFNNVSSANNIGLLKLSKEVKFKDYIRPICLIPGTHPQPAEFIGYAWNQLMKDIEDNKYWTKEFGPIRIEPKRNCQDIDFYSQFCAGHEGNSQSCDGLAGSALTQNYSYENRNRYVQFGIATLSDMDCQGAQGYTNVTDFYLWIQDVVTLFDHSKYMPKHSYSASATSRRAF
ncbi:hypothetical protein KR084_003877 [Drosophila pseudotakahashii]|nr:hypothetical protein KR084_003877 [Drosophila pseudotakahashii]